jgi:hypothetical protein
MFTFNIIGVAPILHFFNYQQDQANTSQKTGVAYLSSHQCSLDAVLRTIEHADFDPSWKPEDITQSVLNFWLSNLDSVTHWQQRLNDAGNETILVSRVAHTQALRNELEAIFRG